MEYHRKYYVEPTVSYIHTNSFSLYTEHKDTYIQNFFNKYYNINNGEKNAKWYIFNGMFC